MGFGHYVSACKNPLNLKWYLYNDANVEEIKESNIVNQNAYILIYK